MTHEMTLTRSLIDARHHGQAPVEGQWTSKLSQTELDESLETAVAAAGNGGFWLFAYGSLLWKPEFPFTEQRLARVYGYHRRFCLWQWRWRGTEDAPNLMLALAPGGSCAGLAYRIEGPGLHDKLGPVWRRELAGDGYRPCWMTAATDSGPLRLVTFVANRVSERYAGRLAEDDVARYIAAARGHGGTGAEYLLNTTVAQERLGVRDKMLWRLQNLVAKYMV